MSDTVKAWHEMQEEKLVSLQADEAIAKELKRANGILIQKLVKHFYTVQVTSLMTASGW